MRVHVIGAPFEPAAGERAQVPGQPPLARHEVQPHFELLFEFLLRITVLSSALEIGIDVN